jgi:hypothetical protein
VNRFNRDIVKRPGDAHILAQLNRIVSCPPFTKSPMLTGFLRFVVEEVIAGREDRIKAYTIATGALGRDASFDPQIDAIVRVEAGRLRLALEHYYANAGRDDPLVIVIPRGTYVPVFRLTVAPPIMVHLHAMRRRISGALRADYRQVLLIAAIAVTLDVLAALVANMLWPSLRGALEPPRAVISEEQQPQTLLPDPG